jgi:hypothetical protein
MSLSEEEHTQKQVTMLTCLGLFLAFISGVVLTLLAVGITNLANGNFLAVVGLEVAALVAPLCIGIIVPLIVNRRGPVRIAAGLGVSLLVLAGIAVCALPFAVAADAQFDAYCNAPGHECHIGDIATPFTLLYVMYGAVLIILSAPLTGLVLKLIKKRQTRREGRRDDNRTAFPVRER